MSQDISEVDLDHAYALIEAIARQKDRYAEKVLSILSEKIEDLESNPKVWMETFAVRMAGEMRLDAAIPIIVAKLKESEEDADWFNSQCESALVQIGGDATIHAVADMLRQGDWHLRITACGVLDHVHSDLAVTAALELLPYEEDPAIRASLAAGLAYHFAFEAIEPVRQMVIDGTYDETCADLKRDLVTAAALMGVEFPERELWKADVVRKRLELENKRLEEESQRLKGKLKRLASKKKSLDREKLRLSRQHVKRHEEEPPKDKIGRNDPCPCGSGKKFEKCCIRKQGDDLLD